MVRCDEVQVPRLVGIDKGKRAIALQRIHQVPYNMHPSSQAAIETPTMQTANENTRPWAAT